MSGIDMRGFDDDVKIEYFIKKFEENHVLLRSTISNLFGGIVDGKVVVGAMNQLNDKIDVWVTYCSTCKKEKEEKKGFFTNFKYGILQVVFGGMLLILVGYCFDSIKEMKATINKASILVEEKKSDVK